MKIYFAGSIRGARDDQSVSENREIISYLKTLGDVLTEHVGDAGISAKGEDREDKFIHDRDMEWISRSDAVIANVSKPSLGVGYEVRRCIELNKPILCIYRRQEKKLSGMIGGSGVPVFIYESMDDLKEKINEFIKENK